MGRSADEVRDFYFTFLDRLATIPGLDGVTVAEKPPRVRNVIGYGGLTVRAEGMGGDEGVSVEYNQVHWDYFETLGLDIPYLNPFFYSDMTYRRLWLHS